MRVRVGLCGFTIAIAYVMFNNMPRVADAKRFLRLLGSESRATT